jgi:hypothetical protein
MAEKKRSYSHILKQPSINNLNMSYWLGEGIQISVED